MMDLIVLNMRSHLPHVVHMKSHTMDCVIWCQQHVCDADWAWWIEMDLPVEHECVCYAFRDSDTAIQFALLFGEHT